MKADRFLNHAPVFHAVCALQIYENRLLASLAFKKISLVSDVRFREKSRARPAAFVLRSDLAFP